MHINMNTFTSKNPIRNAMRLSALCLTLGLAAYSGALSAQEDTHKRGPITDLDTDGDGSISFAEFQAVEGERFAAADSNGDGLLSFEEFAAAAPPPPGRRPEGREVDAERVAEMQARMEERAREEFSETDANGDGMLSLLEMQEAQFLRLDRDNNGVLEGRELRRPNRGPLGEGGPHGGRRPPRQGQSQAEQ